MVGKRLRNAGRYFSKDVCDWDILFERVKVEYECYLSKVRREWLVDMEMGEHLEDGRSAGVVERTAEEGGIGAVHFLGVLWVHHRR